MKIRDGLLWVALIAPAPLLAQPQIGGGTCSTASVSGTCSFLLAGRDASSSLAFTKALQGVGTASFDGLSKVTFTFTGNTNAVLGMAQTLSGTYTIQSNCIGTVSIASGDTATFSLASYNQGKSYLLTGQDGTYSFTGSGGLMPAATCTAALLTGPYAFNGNGFITSAGSVTGVNAISGVLTFDGKGVVTGTWYVSANGSTAASTLTGQFTVAAGCTATATVANTLGTSYNLQLVITSNNGSNFLIDGSNSVGMFSGSGRTL